MSLYNLRLEKRVIGAILKSPDVLAEVDSFLTVEDFYNDVHKSIYSVIRNAYVAGDRIDVVLISDKMKNIGITAKDSVNIYEYLDGITFSAPKASVVPDYARQLIKYRIRRDIIDTSNSIEEYINNCEDDSVDDIISKSDAIYSDKIFSYELDDSPENI